MQNMKPISHDGMHLSRLQEGADCADDETGDPDHQPPRLQAIDVGRVGGGQDVCIHYCLCSPGVWAGCDSFWRSSGERSAPDACWLSCSARM